MTETSLAGRRDSFAPVGARPPTPAGLSARLREATREAHLSAEAAFALNARLESSDAYVRLLAALRGFHRPVEAALAAVPGWSGLTPGLHISSRLRAGLLDEDLRQLGVPAPPGPARPGVVSLPTLAHGLGCLYVLEGSALGGRIIARRACAALGADLPVAFFSSAGRADPGAGWRAFQSSLDAYGTCHGLATRRTVTTSALTTFQALANRLPPAGPCR